MGECPETVSHMKKIKVLAVITSEFRSREGISTVLLDYFRRFDKTIFALELAAFATSSPEVIQDFRDAGVTIRQLPSRKESTIGYVKALMGLMRRERYDIVYVHGSSAIMSIELGAAWLCRCRVRMVHSHNTTCDHKKADRLLRPFFYRLYTDALACGEEAGKWMYGNRAFRVMKNGRDVNRYRFNPETRSRMRKALNLPENTLAVGHVGNFNQQKNQAFLLDAFGELKKKRPDARLFLMGEGPMREEVTRKARQMGLADSVVFTGSIGNVDEMLQAMDVMALPSVHEGLPLVAVEWQMAGLPCVLSDRVTEECACTDLVHFLPLENPAAWAEMLERIAFADRAGDTGRVIAQIREKGFDIDQNAAELQKFFADKCGER